MRKDCGNVLSAALASDENWAEAVRRERVLRPLLSVDRLEAAQVKAAAANLGLSTARIYSLLQRFRENPVTSSLLPAPPGPAKGTRVLHAVVDKHVDRAIEDVFLARERPTLKKVLTEVRRSCRVAGLKAPSMNALRARVSARSLPRTNQSS
jgi:putative transposase